MYFLNTKWQIYTDLVIAKNIIITLLTNYFVDLDKKIEDKVYDKILGNEKLQTIKQKKTELLMKTDESQPQIETHETS